MCRFNYRVPLICAYTGDKKKSIHKVGHVGAAAAAQMSTSIYSDDDDEVLLYTYSMHE